MTRGYLTRPRLRGAPVQARFEQKLEYDANVGCWLWAASADENGYGTFFDGTKTVKAHRAAWTIYVGEIPEGLQVLHRCDTPACVNPKHLFLGTLADNIADCIDKGRRHSTRGVLNAKCVLTEDDVRAILADPRGDKAIADDYGVVRGTIWAIRNGPNWRHLKGEPV